MILKIELENQHFLSIDFENSAYITGSNQKQLWKVFCSLYYYFNKDPKLTNNIYGENKIEILLDDNPLSLKNNNVFFINNRESIYDQMVYKKDSLLFDLLNSLESDSQIDRSVEILNDESLKLEISVQELLKNYSNNLNAEFKNITYLDFLKSNLLMGYQSEGINYPLEFMDTEILLDEFLNFLKFKLENTGVPTWLVLYNMDSFISDKDKANFISKIKDMTKKYDLKFIYIGNTLRSVPISVDDLSNIIISAQDFHQLLPFEDLIRSVEMHYPNELTCSDLDFVSMIQRVVPYVGSKDKLFISGRDLVLLKVINEILGYETSFNLDDQVLSDAECRFLED